MNTHAAHERSWQIAEVIFGIPFLLGLGIHVVRPVALTEDSLVVLIRFVGIVLILIGLCTVIVTRREFRRYHQPTDPGLATNMLITTGAFGLSRNPLYLASALLLGGIALLMNALWPLLAVLIALPLCHFILIVPEEKYLTAQFGAEYQAYCAAVHRWLGRKARI